MGKDKRQHSLDSIKLTQIDANSQQVNEKQPKIQNVQLNKYTLSLVLKDLN
jgi:hypothetical protein